MYQRICVKYSNLSEEVYKRFWLAEEIWIPVVLKFDKQTLNYSVTFYKHLNWTLDPIFNWNIYLKFVYYFSCLHFLRFTVSEIAEK